MKHREKLMEHKEKHFAQMIASSHRKLKRKDYLPEVPVFSKKACVF
jgi:hypothetical protein